MKLTILSEDTVYRHGLLGEHGLSILLELEGEKWLFDAGQLGAVTHNADQMGIDLRLLSGIVLSHGHYDHTGGLLEVLKRSGPKAIYCHPGIFVKRYAVRGRKMRRRINPPWRKKTVETAGGEFLYNRAPRELSANLSLSGEIPNLSRFKEAGDTSLRIERSGRLTLDFHADEQCLMVTGKKGLVVLIGCAHRGLIGTLEHARLVSGMRRIYAVVGGMHLRGVRRQTLEGVMGALKRMGVQRIAACHCTGPAAVAALKSAFPRRFIPCSTGTVIEL
jgi:7,8-dihydropterin-6-yl-methyl-4-(beta-D-ribofuranosyl)aminobenzene 5'-phosphate synthase